MTNLGEPMALRPADNANGTVNPSLRPCTISNVGKGWTNKDDVGDEAGVQRVVFCVCREKQGCFFVGHSRDIRFWIEQVADTLHF